MQAEIVTIEVRDDKIVSATMKAPGLPDGFHDLFCDSGGYRIAELEKLLREVHDHGENSNLHRLIGAALRITD